MHKIIYSPHAEEELEAAFARYRNVSLPLVQQFSAELDHSLCLIAEAPDRWPEYYRHLRFHRVRGFPYKIIYEYSLDTVTIVAIAHGARDRLYWQK